MSDSLWTRLFDGNHFPVQRICSDFVPCMTCRRQCAYGSVCAEDSLFVYCFAEGSLQNGKSKQDHSDFVNVHKTVAALIGCRYPELQPLIRFDSLRSKQQACMSVCASVVIAKKNVDRCSKNSDAGF